MAGQVVNIGHQGYSKLINYFNVRKASQIDGVTLLQEHIAKT